MPFWNSKTETRKGLCVLYLNVTGLVDPDKALQDIKKSLLENQGLDKFLAENNHKFVAIPVQDKTRMEFIWF